VSQLAEAEDKLSLEQKSLLLVSDKAVSIGKLRLRCCDMIAETSARNCRGINCKGVSHLFCLDKTSQNA